MNSINKTARMAGFLYLICIVVEILADVFVWSFPTDRNGRYRSNSQ
jgi:hypothetical protein